jgi:transcriptional regulator with GAF, ATPase, and Fis domain
MNLAAEDLLEISPRSRRVRLIVNLFRREERSAVRQLIDSVVHPQEGSPFSVEPEALDATVSLPDGRQASVTLIVCLVGDGGYDGALLHWEVRRSSSQVAGKMAAERASSDNRHAYALQRLADAASDIAEQDSPAETLRHIANQARAAVACDDVGVTLARRHGAVETPAATGELARECDRLQFELGEGPSFGALDEAAPISVPDMRTEARWPRFAPRAAELGVGSMLVLPLAAPRGTLGALNLYARTPAGFDEDSELIAHAFATHAAIALAHAQMESNLRTAMASREEIGRAVGILMERHRLSAPQAFDMLVHVSQRLHRKLRDIAAWVDATGEDPSTLLAPGRRQVR